MERICSQRERIFFLTTLSVPIFITHVRILRNRSCANGPEITQKWEKRIKWGKAKIRNRYNQVPHLAQGTAWESDKTHENTTYKRANRSVLSQHMGGPRGVDRGFKVTKI